MKVLWTIWLAALAHSCAGQGSNRREAVIQDWIQKIREAPRGHSMSPSWSSKSRIPVKFAFVLRKLCLWNMGLGSERLSQKLIDLYPFTGSANYSLQFSSAAIQCSLPDSSERCEIFSPEKNIRLAETSGTICLC